MAKTLQLNNGLQIPVVGLGTYKVRSFTVKQAVKDAIDAGYKHFDCAWFYGNEAEVGDGLREKIEEGAIKREDLFVTSKLWNNFHKKDRVVPMLKDTLNKMKLDYIDLFLIHWPMGFKESADLLPLSDIPGAFSNVDYLETWQGMEECVRLGLAKSIGLSNFNSEQLDRVLQNCQIKPVVNQVELNLNLNQKKLLQFCKDRDVVVVGFCPLGRAAQTRPEFPTPTADPKIEKIGKKHGKTATQVILNYLVSLGAAVLPMSVTRARMIENIQIFYFELNSEDVAYLDSFNKNQRICIQTAFKDHKYYPFNIEF